MRNNKLVTFLVSLLIAVGLWVYAVTVVNPDDTKTVSNIPVSFTNLSVLERKGLMITGGNKQYISMELSGKRSDLKQINNSNTEAVVDLSRLDAAGNYELTWSLDLPSTVASGDIGVVSSSSNKVRIKVSDYIHDRQIPLRVEYIGTLPEGLVLDPEVLSTETVGVSGPAEELELISEAVITVELDNLTESMDGDVPYRFVDSEGATPELSENVTLTFETVHLYVPVLHYREIRLEADLISGGGVTEKDVTVSFDPPIIAVSGTEAAMENFDGKISLEIDLAKVSHNDTWTFVPELPAGINFRGNETSVSVSVRFSGISVRTFTIACADIIRINDVETLGFGEQKVSFRIRGKAADVNALTMNQLQVSADMTEDYDPVTKTVTLTIVLPGGLQAAVLDSPCTVQVIEVDPNETG